MTFINKYGLLNSRKQDSASENTLLFTIQYLHLYQNKKLEANILEYIKKITNWTFDMYDNIPDAPLGHKDEYTSPDQLIALCAVDLFTASKIWSHLINNLFTYDNRSGKINFKRLMQPQAVFFAAVMSCVPIRFLFVPLLSISCIYACFKGKRNNTSSGVLKSLVCLTAAKMKITKKICELIIKDWWIYRKMYFEEGHPIFTGDL